jgi:hypothetical protein
MSKQRRKRKTKAEMERDHELRRVAKLEDLSDSQRRRINRMTTPRSLGGDADG